MSIEAKKVIPGNSNRSIYNIIKTNSLDAKDELKLFNYVNSKKKIIISTPFSREAAKRLIKFKVPAFKVGSGEASNFHFVKYLTQFKIPIIMSTGMNSIKSIYKSVDIILKKKIPLALLHCTNIYPTPENLVRLDCVSLLKRKFPKCVVGLSDHTSSIYTCLGAVALGARIIEKHFTDTKKRKGPDISSSMDPKELAELIKGSLKIFHSRGSNKEALKEEKKTIAFAFPSVVALKNLNVGEILNENNIFLKRPGTGDFGVNDLQNLYGKKVKKFIVKNSQLSKKNIFYK